MSVEPKPRPPQVVSSPPFRPSGRASVAALAGLAATWLAAGSTGLLARPFAHGLSWLALGVGLIAAWPGRSKRTDRLLLAAALVAAVAMMVPAAAVYNVLGVCLVLAVLSRASAGVDRRLLLLSSLAAAVLAVYLLACGSIPAVWSAANALGALAGRLVAAVAGRPLRIEASFAGLDFLIVMAAVYAGWLAWTAPPRGARAAWAAVVILAGHGLYLVVVAYAKDLYELLPPPPPPPEFRDYIPAPWSWSDGVRSLLPWNVPLLAGAIHLAIAGLMFRWTAWSPLPEAGSEESSAKKKRGAGAQGKQPAAPQAPGDLRGHLLAWAPVVLATLVPLVTTLAPGRSTLAGKTIVAANQGYLDWERPVHGRYGQASAGMYGMLPDFVASLGGRLVASDELAPRDLAEADVLLIIHPLGRWPEDRLDRVREFVRGGGSLLLLAGTPIRDGARVSSYNEVLDYVLAPSRGIEVLFDSAKSATWRWQDAYAPMVHPAALGVDDGRDRFGMPPGPSIRLRWPARPLLVGRWGWSDPGVDSALTRVFQYDTGEKLGDLVLAAEQRLGRGRVVVVSNAFGFTNEGNVSSYVFTGRLLAYLAGGAGSPQAGWRQLLGILGCIALVGLFAFRPAPTRVATAAVVLALVLAGSRTLGSVSMRVLPDGRRHAAYNNVAYIDASHMEAYGDSGWGFEGTAGLALTLMRSGFQAFLLPDLTTERLKRAGLLVSIAPARPFSPSEQAAVRQFVERGGTFLCTVGADRAGPVQPLLEDFGLRVPPIPVPPQENVREPAPMGHFRTLYRAWGADYDSGLLIYHGWPVECGANEVLVRGFGNLPIIALAKVGRGNVIVVGDTAFAMNKNLEYTGGEPFAGRYDNAHFWRWLLGSLTGQEARLPPSAQEAGAAEGVEQGVDRPEDEAAPPTPGSAPPGVGPMSSPSGPADAADAPPGPSGPLMADPSGSIPHDAPPDEVAP